MRFIFYKIYISRCNVNLLKIIQIGLSFFNKDGDIPEGVCCWQFNFKFNLSEVKIKEKNIKIKLKKI